MDEITCEHGLSTLLQGAGLARSCSHWLVSYGLRAICQGGLEKALTCLSGDLASKPWQWWESMFDCVRECHIPCKVDVVGAVCPLMHKPAREMPASEHSSTLLMGVCVLHVAHLFFFFLHTSFRRVWQCLSKHSPNCSLGIYPTDKLECAEGNVRGNNCTIVREEGRKQVNCPLERPN